MRIVAPVWAFVPKLLTSGIEVGNHSHSFEIKTKNIWLLMYGHKNVKIIDFLKLHTLPYIIVIFSEIGPNSFKFIHGESMLLWILSRIMYTLKCIFRNFTFFKIYFYWCILEPDFLTACLTVRGDRGVQPPPLLEIFLLLKNGLRYELQLSHVWIKSGGACFRIIFEILKSTWVGHVTIFHTPCHFRKISKKSMSLDQFEIGLVGKSTKN